MLEEAVVARITEARRRTPAGRSVLVAVTGIDGSGKGYVASRIVRGLEGLGLRAEALNVDGWLNLPSARFDASNPAEHFYRNAIRFEEMFERLVLPLRDRRSVRVEADFAEETAHAFRRHAYAFEDVDLAWSRPDGAVGSDLAGSVPRWAYRNDDCIYASDGPLLGDLDVLVANAINAQMGGGAIGTVRAVSGELSEQISALDRVGRAFWDFDEREIAEPPAQGDDAWPLWRPADPPSPARHPAVDTGGR